MVLPISSCLRRAETAALTSRRSVATSVCDSLPPSTTHCQPLSTSLNALWTSAHTRTHTHTHRGGVGIFQASRCPVTVTHRYAQVRGARTHTRTRTHMQTQPPTHTPTHTWHARCDPVAPDCRDTLASGRGCTCVHTHRHIHTNTYLHRLVTKVQLAAHGTVANS